MRPEAIPLSPEDRAILELESPTVAGHTCKVVVLGHDGPDVAALRASVAERIEAAPALTRRLDGPPGALAWVPDEAFELERHIVDAGGSPVDASGLRAVVARLFEQRLDRARPLWRLDLVPMEAGKALVWRLHHAVADGTTAMRYASALLWDRDGSPADPGAPSAHANAAADDRRRRGHLAGFLRREFARTRDPSPFDGQIGTRRQIAFATAPLAGLHDAARRLAGATVNDAVLAVVSGALRRWLQHDHGSLGELRAKVPVSLHHEGDDAGNRDSFFAVALPLGEPDPVVRLAAVHAATAERKADHDAEQMEALLRDLGRLSPGLQSWCSRIQRSPRRFALNVSNVPGPRDTVGVLGSPVSSMHSIAEIGERHALRVSVVSSAGRLCFGFCADPAIVHDLDRIAAGTEAEAAALIESAGSGAGP